MSRTAPYGSGGGVSPVMGAAALGSLHRHSMSMGAPMMQASPGQAAAPGRGSIAGYPQGNTGGCVCPFFDLF
jgi:hypothetical protein